MICFDFITNQTDRHDKNYGIILEKRDGKTNISFAPLFDSDYIFHDESYPDKEDIAFNMGEKVDSNALMKLITKKYPDDVRKFQKNLKSNESQIYEIIKENFSDKKIEGIFTGIQEGVPKSIIDVYLEVVKGNISKFNEIIQQHSLGKNLINKDELQLTFNENDIRALAKQSNVVIEKENAIEARHILEQEQELNIPMKD